MEAFDCAKALYPLPKMRGREKEKVRGREMTQPLEVDLHAPE